MLNVLYTSDNKTCSFLIYLTPIIGTNVLQTRFGQNHNRHNRSASCSILVLQLCIAWRINIRHIVLLLCLLKNTNMVITFMNFFKQIVTP